ncbi:MAG: acyl-CoA dehydrogenase [Oligoflexia bacterium]|nr:acyl-CoA dehydrogenase [Oligoflexia bacterium]MBF0365011.1 acyl-CoA dehydrogenase [Oligoflexia bacterium]
MAILLNPKHYLSHSSDPVTQEIMQKTINFFEKKGLAKIKADDHECVWYNDFLSFLKEENILSSLLTPSQYGKHSFNTARNVEFNEILGFYGLNYWYPWQVTVLGLGPIWMSDNEAVKKQAAKFLSEGEIFGFGLSEQKHGADLYASEMRLIPEGNGKYRAVGEKYYIGNGNEAKLVSTFGKIEGGAEDEYVFFVVDPKHPNYECVKNTVHSQNYVAHYKLNNYPITDADILSRGRKAWDDSLNTINIGKYNLGWASIGICTHAFYEALDHASNRYLFKSYVTEFTHIKWLFFEAYMRLVSMRLFSLRACDYMRAAQVKDKIIDRRYLLYNPIVKMKVTTQGEDVMSLLWDVIAAKGCEKDTYFEMALRDIRALPKLEGTVHVNMALIIKFMKNYFFNPGTFAEVPRQLSSKNDDFLFQQGPTKGLSKIKFHDYRKVYDSVTVHSPNLKIFKKQIRKLRWLLILGRPTKEQISDFDFLLNLGELFTLVVYGQLIIENLKLLQLEKGQTLLDHIFYFLVKDFSKYALKIHLKHNITPVQSLITKQMLERPLMEMNQFEDCLKNAIYSLNGSYTMNI